MARIYISAPVTGYDYGERKKFFHDIDHHCAIRKLSSVCRQKQILSAIMIGQFLHSFQNRCLFIFHNSLLFALMSLLYDITVFFFRQ